MAIYIKIQKISESDHIGYYEVSSDNFGGCHFFVGFDRLHQTVSCYATQDFSSPIKIMRFDVEETVASLPGISASILGRIVIIALRVFKMNTFPEFLDYAA